MLEGRGLKRPRPRLGCITRGDAHKHVRDDYKMDLKKMKCKGMHWIQLAPVI
jgi:hypothetical protein